MQTVRQAFTILKQNPLLSTISILGTAFAITMIMAIVITWQTKYADLEPEVTAVGVFTFPLCTYTTRKRTAIIIGVILRRHL